ncbi:hypothetical protein DL768_001953 [Monosporascus sp. mg162]|nr:hypothetical protein DL768_001953 [Monosporascus sp. mg162]
MLDALRLRSTLSHPGQTQYATADSQINLSKVGYVLAQLQEKTRHPAEPVGIVNGREIKRRHLGCELRPRTIMMAGKQSVLLDASYHPVLANQLLDARLEHHDHGHSLLNCLVPLLQLPYQLIVHLVGPGLFTLQLFDALLERRLLVAPVEKLELEVENTTTADSY